MPKRDTFNYTYRAYTQRDAVYCGVTLPVDGGFADKRIKLMAAGAKARAGAALLFWKKVAKNFWGWLAPRICRAKGCGIGGERFEQVFLFCRAVLN